MVKKPPSDTNEEEIIRRRDGIAGSASDKPLDADAKRALADARLRALAFALGSEQRPRAAADEIDDTELLAYLLDIVPEHRRTALEDVFRGNADAFGRLMTLRAALNSQTDKRDRQRADDPARRIPRHTAGRIDIRRMEEILEFRDATRPRPSFNVGRLAAAAQAIEPRAHRASRPMAFRQMERPPFQWGEKTEGMLRNLLERVRRDLGVGIDLVNEIQSSLERWRHIGRHEESETRERGAPSDREHEDDLRERLTELLYELKSVASRINEELGDVPYAAADLTPSARIAASLPLDALFEDTLDAPIARHPPTDQGIWADVLDLAAGPWRLHLSGTALPQPKLAISVRANQAKAASVEPFLTLVRPAAGFETVNLDSSGNGKIALPAGESVMLLQADEVWEIRLSFRER
jgi:hypothetical protein